ncbi:MAG: putative amidophosphoribosyltransferase [Paracoccaceae bacterium]|jgi:predicted amidophosphoribosyltransferase
MAYPVTQIMRAEVQARRQNPYFICQPAGTQMVNSFLRHASFQLFTRRCMLCLANTQTADDICRACREELPCLGPHCSRCTLPLASTSICGQCLQSPPQFDKCLAVWEYGYPIDQMISRFKYQGRRLEGDLLARLALDSLRLEKEDRPDVIAPIPMHWRQRLQRGFNQAELIAKHWSAALNIPMASGLYRQH